MSELPRSNRHIPWSERRDGGTLEFFEPGWRNGSRSAPKKRGPKGRVGSTPTPGTIFLPQEWPAAARLVLGDAGCMAPVFLFGMFVLS